MSHAGSARRNPAPLRMRDLLPHLRAIEGWGDELDQTEEGAPGSEEPPRSAAKPRSARKRTTPTPRKVRPFSSKKFTPSGKRPASHVKDSARCLFFNSENHKPSERKDNSFVSSSLKFSAPDDKSPKQTKDHANMSTDRMCQPNARLGQSYKFSTPQSTTNMSANSILREYREKEAIAQTPMDSNFFRRHLTSQPSNSNQNRTRTPLFPLLNEPAVGAPLKAGGNTRTNLQTVTEKENSDPSAESVVDVLNTSFECSETSAKSAVQKNTQTGINPTIDKINPTVGNLEKIYSAIDAESENLKGIQTDNGKNQLTNIYDRSTSVHNRNSKMEDIEQPNSVSISENLQKHDPIKGNYVKFSNISKEVYSKKDEPDKPAAGFFPSNRTSTERPIAETNPPHVTKDTPPAPPNMIAGQVEGLENCLTSNHSTQKQLATMSIKGRTYIVLGKLGSGGSSDVYKVMDIKNSSMYAVKCVNMAVDSVTAEGFVNEIKLLQRLQGSDRVITMYEYEYIKQQKKLYVVLEMGDTDLSNLLKSYRSKETFLPYPILLGYWTEMLTAVNHIHKNGIIHSDLKPANFLLVHGRLKLIDFGIASSLNADATSIMKNSTAGTFNYISPEAITMSAANETAKISYKSDVWSLGCILYSMLYGHTPFSHVKQLYAKIAALSNPNQKIEYPPLKDVPPVLMKALQWCLTFDVKKRPSVQDLIDMPYINGTDTSRPSEEVPLNIIRKIKSVLTDDEWELVAKAMGAK